MVNKKCKGFIGLTFIFLLHTLFVQARSTRLNAESAREHLERARSYASAGNPRAEQEYRQAIADRGGVYAAAWKELSDYLAQRQRFDEAANAFRKYLTQARHKRRSLNLVRLHRLDRGAELRSKSDRGDVLSVDEMLEFVALVEGFGATGDAIPYAEQAVKLYPESATALIALAKVLRWKQKERALELLDRAVAFEPNEKFDFELFVPNVITAVGQTPVGYNGDQPRTYQFPNTPFTVDITNDGPSYPACFVVQVVPRTRGARRTRFKPLLTFNHRWRDKQAESYSSLVGVLRSGHK